MTLSFHMVERLEEHIAIWQKSLATLPDGYLRTERRDLGDHPIGTRRLVAELLDGEIERRRRPGELPL